MSKTIKVRYFAVLRERRGLTEEQLTTDLETVGDILAFLIAEHRLGLPIALVRVAVANEFAENDSQLEDGAELVLIPPVAGG